MRMCAGSVVRSVSSGIEARAMRLRASWYASYAQKGKTCLQVMTMAGLAVGAGGGGSGGSTSRQAQLLFIGDVPLAVALQS